MNAMFLIGTHPLVSSTLQRGRGGMGDNGSVAPCLVGSIGTVGALVTSVSPMHTPPTLNTAKLIWGTSRFVTILFITSVTTVIFQITEKVHRNTHSAICTTKLRNWITRNGTVLFIAVIHAVILTIACQTRINAMPIRTHEVTRATRLRLRCTSRSAVRSFIAAIAAVVDSITNITL